MKQRKVTFTDQQWNDLEDLSRERNISVSALLREITDAALKLHKRKEPLKP